MMPSQDYPLLLGTLFESNGDNLSGLKIYEGACLTIGRDRGCNITLDDSSVSKIHIKIYSVGFDHTIPSFVYARDVSTNGSHWMHEDDGHWSTYAIGKGKSVMLSEGDRIKLCNGSTYTFRSVIYPHTTAGNHCETQKVQNLEMKSFDNLYRITNRPLGVGSTGRVNMAIDRSRRRQVACKMVTLNTHPHEPMMDRNFASKLRREVELLKDLSHPNIVHVERVFHSANTLYIIEDLVTGGDLHSYLERNGSCLDDMDACCIIYQVLQALSYLHGNSVIHRDLKPENILMSVPVAGAKVILTDFGMAIKVAGATSNRSQRMVSACGTAGYAAPEMHRRLRYATCSAAIDMWSVGAIITTLLTGRSIISNTQDSTSVYPFDFADLDETELDLTLDNMDNSLTWSKKDHRAKNLVKKLLVHDAKARWLVSQALSHSWFTDDDRKNFIETVYMQAIRDWMPSRPAWDFNEHLDVFSKARKLDGPCALRVDEGERIDQVLSKAKDQQLQNSYLPHGKVSKRVRMEPQVATKRISSPRLLGRPCISSSTSIRGPALHRQTTKNSLLARGCVQVQLKKVDHPKVVPYQEVRDDYSDGNSGKTGGRHADGAMRNLLARASFDTRNESSREKCDVEESVGKRRKRNGSSGGLSYVTT